MCIRIFVLKQLRAREHRRSRSYWDQTLFSFMIPFTIRTIVAFFVYFDYSLYIFSRNFDALPHTLQLFAVCLTWISKIRTCLGAMRCGALFKIDYGRFAGNGGEFFGLREPAQTKKQIELFLMELISIKLLKKQRRASAVFYGAWKRFRLN